MTSRRWRSIKPYQRAVRGQWYAQRPPSRNRVITSERCARLLPGIPPNPIVARGPTIKCRELTSPDLRNSKHRDPGGRRPSGTGSSPGSNPAEAWMLRDQPGDDDAQADDFTTVCRPASLAIALRGVPPMTSPLPICGWPNPLAGDRPASSIPRVRAAMAPALSTAPRSVTATTAAPIAPASATRNQMTAVTAIAANATTVAGPERRPAARPARGRAARPRRAPRRRSAVGRRRTCRRAPRGPSGRTSPRARRTTRSARRRLSALERAAAPRGQSRSRSRRPRGHGTPTARASGRAAPRRQAVSMPPVEPASGCEQVEERGEQRGASSSSRQRERDREYARAAARAARSRDDTARRAEQRQRDRRAAPGEPEERHSGQQASTTRYHSGMSGSAAERPAPAGTATGTARCPRCRGRCATAARRPAAAPCRRCAPPSVDVARRRCTSPATCARAAPRPCRSRAAAASRRAPSARRWCQTIARRVEAERPARAPGSRQQTSTSSPAARKTGSKPPIASSAARRNAMLQPGMCSATLIREQHVDRPAGRVARRSRRRSRRPAAACSARRPRRGRSSRSVAAR